MQPMDQGVITHFKAYYLQQTFQQLLNDIDRERKPTIHEWWRSYNILKAKDNIPQSWSQIIQKCMNSIWKK